MTTPSIVLFTDDCRLAAGLQRELAGRFDLQRCNGALNRLAEDVAAAQADAVVVDFRRVGSGGHAEDAVLAIVQDRGPERPLVMLTGEDCPEPLARRAACTNLIHVCDGRPAEAVAAALCERLTRVGPQAPGSSALHPAGGVPAGSGQRFETATPSMAYLLQELELAAGHDVTILLVGETGVGKTFLAKWIHETSPRRNEPFLTVACGALPGELVESELFGHAKGAFTSAHTDKQGKFVVAAGGTILLDEIDVLQLEQQVKLLRVIETGQFEPVGSNVTLHSAARLVVASNRELEPLVESGRFRADLYYRLNMLKFDVPPLRERPADVAPLAQRFIRRHARTHGVQVRAVDERVIPLLQGYSWPGNVRELENVLRRAVIYCRDGVLTPNLLPTCIREAGAGMVFRDGVRPAANAFPANSPSDVFPRNGMDEEGYHAQTLGGKIEHTEREIIRQALHSHSFNRTKTAKSLGISRVTLYNKMRKYGIKC